jgi:molecular chaperone DnaK (HSP70)
MVAIAVDFGSSNTVIAAWNAISNQPQTLKLPDLARAYPQDFLIPSVVYVEDAKRDRVCIGQEVISKGYSQRSPRYFSGTKRCLAMPTGFVPKVDGVELAPELLGKLFLRELFNRLQAQQIDIKEAIFAVPVQSYERYLRWLESCGKTDLLKHAPGSRLRTIDEPTAAALGYAIAQPGLVILVIDFGGGTLDLSLVRTPSNDEIANWGSYVGEDSQNTDVDEGTTQVEVIAKTGQTLGGIDIDRWLLEDYLASHQSTQPEPATNNFLLLLMERLKVKLSTAESATEVWFNPESLEAHEISYSRAQFESILRSRGFYRVLQSAIDDAIHFAAGKGILKMDIKHIALIGGSTQIPSVQNLIAQDFPRATIYSDKPFEAVAHGALSLSRGAEIKDYLFHSYAIRYWQSQTQQWQYQPLFLKGQAYPTTRSIELLLCASHRDQATIELVIGELEKRSPNSVEVIFDGDRLVTIVNQNPQEVFVPLSEHGAPQAIATLEPLGQPGSDRLKVMFSVDEYRRLLISAIDLETQKQILTNQPVATLR